MAQVNQSRIEFPGVPQKVRDEAHKIESLGISAGEAYQFGYLDGLADGKGDKKSYKVSEDCSEAL